MTLNASTGTSGRRLARCASILLVSVTTVLAHVPALAFQEGARLATDVAARPSRSAMPAPRFARSAVEVTLKIELDAGALSRRLGGQEIYLFHPVPYSNEFHTCAGVKATLDGQEMGVMADARNHPTFFARANAQSGVACIEFSAVVFERVIGARDRLPHPVALTPEERERYLAESRCILTSDPDYKTRMRAEGLQRNESEPAWDYMQRVAEYTRTRFAARDGAFPVDLVKTAHIFDAECFNCNGANVFIARLARNNGVPYRCLPGAVLFPDGHAEYHSRGEFYDEDRGWVPIDGGVLVSIGKAGELAEGFGRDHVEGWQAFVPLMDNSATEIVVKGDGGEDGPRFYSEFNQGFSYGVVGRLGGGNVTSTTITWSARSVELPGGPRYSSAR